jgi:hypothetical protein
VEFEEELQTVVEQLTSQLLAHRTRGHARAATVVLGQAKLPLSSWEVSAVVESSRTVSQSIQRSAAVRVMLFRELERVRRGEAPDRLPGLLVLAREETRRLQNTLSEDHAAEAKVALSTATQHLAGLLSETERFLRTRRSGSRQP